MQHRYQLSQPQLGYRQGLVDPHCNLTSIRRHGSCIPPSTPMTKYDAKAPADNASPTGPMLKSISSISLRTRAQSQNGISEAPAGQDTALSASKSQWPVCVYVPNLVCYLRLILTAAAWREAVRGHAQVALAMFLASVSLDFVDGLLARALNQVSGFGAFLDVLVDNLTRGALWCLACPSGLGVLPVVLEMTAFVATHKGGGAAWKEGCFSNAPSWVRWLMADGFRTPQGTLVVAGLFGAPLWLWAQQALPGHPILSSTVLGAVLLIGRAMAGAVECWVISRHLAGLLQDDHKAVSTRQQHT